MLYEVITPNKVAVKIEGVSGAADLRVLVQIVGGIVGNRTILGDGDAVAEPVVLIFHTVTGGVLPRNELAEVVVFIFPASVITSYSIHYTKLYEGIHR